MRARAPHVVQSFLWPRWCSGRRMCRAGLLGVPVGGGPLTCWCCLWRRWCSGRRARPLCVPVGGGPPASRPRCELRSARRLEARPGPAAHGRRSQALRSLRRPPHRRHLVRINFACNSPVAPSNHDFATLGLQRFQPLLKPLPIELHASFLGSGHIDTCGRRSRALSTRWPGGLKPRPPLLACACVGLKPRSPLRVRNGRLWGSLWTQR